MSSAKSLDCEIRASCSESRERQFTNQTTVDPGSNVTLNCSIMNGGVAQGMTWTQVKQRINANDGLVFRQINSTTEKNPCRCINFTHKLISLNKMLEEMFKKLSGTKSRPFHGLWTTCLARIRLIFTYIHLTLTFSKICERSWRIHFSTSPRL